MTSGILHDLKLGTPTAAELARIAEAMSERMVFVTMGTDHHRFDRLSDWVENWAADASSDVGVIVQHGPSRAPRHALGFDRTGRDELHRLMRAADVVVAQGGPGGIMDSRSCGRMPIVVPRVARLDEAVDDHQTVFARHMAGLGRVALATTEEEFRRTLDHAVAEPARFVALDDTAHVEQTVRRFGQLVEDLVATPAPLRRRVLLGR